MRVHSIGMDLRAVKSILKSNAERTWNPLGVSESYCSEWAKQLNLPERGETLLYTGCLYQMIPYIELFSSLLKRLESLGEVVSKVSLRFASAVGSLGLNLTMLLGSITISEDDRQRYYALLHRIVVALKKAGIEIAYMREEPYNGVLYHDLGMDEIFERHARRVAQKIRETGAKRVIVVDPHTMYALKHLIPEIVDNWDIEVIHYMDALLERGYKPVKMSDLREIVLHDPCYLARWNEVIDQPRKLLEEAGISVKEPEFSRNFTGCCGGPIESLLPTLASMITQKRINELRETGVNNVVVSCPICLVNFVREAKKLGTNVYDIAEIVVG